jgi:hypothetical protein
MESSRNLEVPAPTADPMPGSSRSLMESSRNLEVPHAASLAPLPDHRRRALRVRKPDSGATSPEGGEEMTARVPSPSP